MIYKNIEITQNLNGLFCAFIINKGWLKADTLKGIKKLINEV